MIYIDELILMLDVERRHATACGVDSSRSRVISDAYADVGLEEERTKGSDGESQAKS